MNTLSKVEEYFLCMLFHLFLPLLPLALECWFLGKISSMSLMLTTSIYAISIGNSSKIKSLFGINIMLGLIFAAVFGGVMNGGQVPHHSELFAKIAILCIFLSSSIERFSTHIIQGRAYWDFK